MSKFNPEDFKAPEMEPLSTVTIFDETIEWDKSAYGVVAAYGDGSMHIVDGEAYYEQPRGEYGEGSVRVSLTIEDNNIDTNVLACSIAAKQEMYKELLEECGGDKMKAMHIQLKRFAANKDITIVKSPRALFEDSVNPERLVTIPTHQMQKANPDYVWPEVNSEAGKLALSQPKARPYGKGELYSPEVRALMGEGDEPVGTISEIDPEIFSKPMTGGFAEGCADLPETKHYYRECSCKSCGAPINFYGVSDKEFNEARFTGKEPNNFTMAELESFFGEVGNIDGVIYDDTRLCSSCKSYDY